MCDQYENKKRVVRAEQQQASPSTREECDEADILWRQYRTTPLSNRSEAYRNLCRGALLLYWLGRGTTSAYTGTVGEVDPSAET